MLPFFGQSVSTRAKLVRRKSEMSIASASASAYEALLQRGGTEGGATAATHGGQEPSTSRRDPSYPIASQYRQQRAWLDAADARRPTWSGERQVPRKLVKDPSGSARPLFSTAIADGTGGTDGPRQQDGDPEAKPAAAEGLRKAMARWKELRLGMAGTFDSTEPRQRLHRRER